MPQFSDSDIRHIKWLLCGILACLVVIAMSVAKWFVPVVVLTALALAVAMLISTLSQSYRDYRAGRRHSDL